MRSASPAYLDRMLLVTDIPNVTEREAARAALAALQAGADAMTG